MSNVAWMVLGLRLNDETRKLDMKIVAENYEIGDWDVLQHSLSVDWLSEYAKVTCLPHHDAFYDIIFMVHIVLKEMPYRMLRISIHSTDVLTLDKLTKATKWLHWVLREVKYREENSKIDASARY